jgi:hypothetical protein
MPVDPKRFWKMPSSDGLVSRLAYARLKQAGIKVALLLKKAKLTVEQIGDRKARLAVQSQIRFLMLAADALHDGLLGFIWPGTSTSARLDCSTMLPHHLIRSETRSSEWCATARP